MISHRVEPDCGHLSEYFKADVKKINRTVLLDISASLTFDNKIISPKLSLNSSNCPS